MEETIVVIDDLLLVLLQLLPSLRLLLDLASKALSAKRATATAL
jgi:hypothetical protein